MDFPKLGITVGDINGIGPEIIIKALAHDYYVERYIPIIYGSTKVMAYFKNIVELSDFSFITVEHPDEARAGKINVINCWHENLRIELGTVSEDSGKAAYIALDRATNDLKNGHIHALVTAPIHKKAMQLAGFGYPGHTEYIAETLGQSGKELMMLVTDQLRVALLSTHVPIAQAANLVTEENLIASVHTLHQSLKIDFGIERPLIAILGLNPHAGDEGVIGQEEVNVIIPTIHKLKKEGIMLSGPFAADGFFGSNQHTKFDAILAMYHDQGLVPFKTLAFGSGVNFTAGLNVIRTSPDHGTGHNIAGTNMADEHSLLHAIYMALDIRKTRDLFEDSHKNKVERTTIRSEQNA